MPGKNQLFEWGDDSESRIIDITRDSKKTASLLSPDLLLDNPSPYTEIEFGYYAHLSAANDLPEFQRKIEESIRDLGFQEFSYFRPSTSGVDSEKLVTVSGDLLTDYFTECFFEHDLILPYADNNTAPVYQSTLHDFANNAPFDIDMTRMMKAIFRLNKSYGYHEFYNTFAKAKSGEGSVILSVTVKGCSPVRLKEIVRGSESTLQLLCEAIDFVASRKFSNTLFGSGPSEDETCFIINPKPLGVLDTLANNDLNISQVAHHLNISVVTANKHLEVARKAFGARTNYAAIKKAITSGLITYRN